MKTTIYVCIFFILSLPTYSQSSEVTGYQAEVLEVLNSAANRILQLAEAVPEDLYEWRPAEGVRSFREVFLHLAGGNYSLPGLMGYEPPEWFERGKFERTITEKDEVIKVLRESFDHHREAIKSFSDEDLEKTVRWFGGRETTIRAAFLSLTRHTAEHLGQLIAYSRVNGVVPPWSQ